MFQYARLMPVVGSPLGCYLFRRQNCFLAPCTPSHGEHPISETATVQQHKQSPPPDAKIKQTRLRQILLPFALSH